MPTLTRFPHETTVTSGGGGTTNPPEFKIAEDENNDRNVEAGLVLFSLIARQEDIVFADTIRNQYTDDELLAVGSTALWAEITTSEAA